MPAREIVRHPDVLDGRWHFAGTTVTVADVRIDRRFKGAEADGDYRYLDLTDDEIAGALSFAFPALREPSLDTLYAAVTMHCECGEDTQQAVTWPTQHELECVCGRTWIIEVTFRKVTKLQAAPSI